MFGKKGSEKKAPKAAKPAAVKQGKSEVQTMRKATSQKILRVILWVILTFIFMRGVLSIIQTSSQPQAAEQIQSYREEMTAAQTRTEELLPFAEGFAREYMTYKRGEEQDYIARLSEYATSNLFSGTRLTGGSAEVLYASAYRHEEYSATQEDVWVRLKVHYTMQEQNPETKEVIQTERDDEMILKVPVACTESGFIVEDYPAFVSDDRKASDYKAEMFSGTSADRATADEVEAALENFFKAYYSDQQSVIKYYLTSDADTGDFAGLQGSVSFRRITDCRVYNQATPEDLLAIVSLEVTDENGMIFTQRFHLKVLYQEGQYYVRSMDTRSKNI